MALFSGNDKKKAAGAKQNRAETFNELNLNSGARLTVTVQSSVRGGERFELVSTYYEAGDDEGSFVISAPMQGTSIFPIHEGDLAVVSVQTANAIYECDAVTEARLAEDGLPFVLLREVSPLRRKQRRTDFRVDVMFKTLMIPADPQNPALPYPGRNPADCLITNFSGGGCAVKLNEELHKSSYVHLALPTDVFGQPKTLICRVQMCRPVDKFAEPGSQWKFFAGLQFLFASASEKDKLVKFAFDTQRKQLTGG